MKPKNLKFPFSWEERHPLLCDGVFYVPDYFDKHDPGILPPLCEYFGNDRPIAIEYCSGNGEWVTNRARMCPEMNWISVEKRFKRVKKIWSKMKNAALSNLLIVRGEAETLSTHYLGEGTVSRIYINFPDPWPKARHAKHRLIKKTFVNEMARIISPQGTSMIVTDDEDYSHQVIFEMLNNTPWKASFSEPHFVSEFQEYGSSYFERLWRNLGRDIRYMEFVKL